mmetsp:Transcript_102831/g.259123  ORF Transcript_102831/g.259123 Transcript_102831/m.259123 type:complete len:737 (+) Transcript_102831:99-2309(+)
MAPAWPNLAAAGVPTWSTYSAGVNGGEGESEAALRDPAFVSYVEHLAGAVRGTVDELRVIEERQVVLDRRLAEFGSLLQGVREEQLVQANTIERGHQVTAVGTQRALNTAVAVKRHIEQEGEVEACLQGLSDDRAKRLEQLCQQHGRWLLELSADVAQLSAGRGRGGGGGKGRRGDRGGTDALCDDDLVSKLDARVSALEQGQKTVAVGARRALHTALVVHQQQQSQDHDNQWEKCLDGLPVAELEQQCTLKFTEQDDRLDKILQMVDSLTDRVLLQQALTDGRAEVHGVRELRENFEESQAKLAEKLEDMKANILGLASEVDSCRVQANFEHALGSKGQMPDFVATSFESLESRLDRGLNEFGQRLESLQDGRDQQRLALRQMGQQLPEVSRKLDQLWSQCQYYFPRVKEHDVHFGFFRTSFETHKQSMLDYTDGLGDHRFLAAARGTGGGAAGGAGGSRAASPAPSVGFGIRGRGASTGCGISGSAGSRPASPLPHAACCEQLAPTPPLQLQPQGPRQQQQQQQQTPHRPLPSWLATPSDASATVLGATGPSSRPLGAAAAAGLLAAAAAADATLAPEEEPLLASVGSLGGGSGYGNSRATIGGGSLPCAAAVTSTPSAVAAEGEQGGMGGDGGVPSSPNPGIGGLFGPAQSSVASSPRTKAVHPVAADEDVGEEGMRSSILEQVLARLHAPDTTEDHDSVSNRGAGIVVGTGAALGGIMGGCSSSSGMAAARN